MKIKSRAKINLALKIKGKQNNGYHLLDLINTNVEFGDIIKIKLVRRDKITITCKGHEIPLDNNNLMYKAIESFKKQYPFKKGVKISIKKNIPVGAGLGGGSSNAAAVLLALNKLLKANLSIDVLRAMALNIGSDVPYFLTGGLARIEGTGEVITPLPPAKDFPVLMIKPQQGISTSECYQKFNLNDTVEINIEKVITGLEKNNLTLVSFYTGNDLAKSAIEILPEIEDIITQLHRHHFQSVLVCGSGSTVIGFSASSEDINNAHANLKKKYPFCIKTKTCNKL